MRWLEEHEAHNSADETNALKISFLHIETI